MTRRYISQPRPFWALLQRGISLAICLALATRLGLAEWHYGEAFRMASGHVTEPTASIDPLGPAIAHMKLAGKLFPFDYRFREAAQTAAAIEAAQ